MPALWLLAQEGAELVETRPPAWQHSGRGCWTSGALPEEMGLASSWSGLVPACCCLTRAPELGQP